MCHKQVLYLQNTQTHPGSLVVDNDVCNAHSRTSRQAGTSTQWDQYIITLTISIISMVLGLGICELNTLPRKGWKGQRERERYRDGGDCEWGRESVREGKR